MIKRQRNAILLVALACLVVLICTAQRMAGMHALVVNVTARKPVCPAGAGEHRRTGDAL